MIQSVMLVALGFFAASLVALIVAPALWARAVRLTIDRVKMSMPVKLSEIQADKDQERAQFAIKIRQAEVAFEKANDQLVTQAIEITRRGSEIKLLEAALQEVSDQLEEQGNANRVLTQTVKSRVPKMEAQLGKAKEILGVRYEEIAQLKTTLSSQADELDKAQTMNQMRQAEVERLKLAKINEHLEDEISALRVKLKNLEKRVRSAELATEIKPKRKKPSKQPAESKRKKPSKQPAESKGKKSSKSPETDLKAVKKAAPTRQDTDLDREIKIFAERIATMPGLPMTDNDETGHEKNPTASGPSPKTLSGGPNGALEKGEDKDHMLMDSTEENPAPQSKEEKVGLLRRLQRAH